MADDDPLSDLKADLPSLRKFLDEAGHDHESAVAELRARSVRATKTVESSTRKIYHITVGLLRAHGLKLAEDLRAPEETPLAGLAFQLDDSSLTLLASKLLLDGVSSAPKTIVHIHGKSCYGVLTVAGYKQLSSTSGSRHAAYAAGTIIHLLFGVASLSTLPVSPSMHLGWTPAEVVAYRACVAEHGSARAVACTALKRLAKMEPALLKLQEMLTFAVPLLPERPVSVHADAWLVLTYFTEKAKRTACRLGETSIERQHANKSYNKGLISKNQHDIASAFRNVFVDCVTPPRDSIAMSILLAAAERTVQLCGEDASYPRLWYVGSEHAFGITALGRSLLSDSLLDDEEEAEAEEEEAEEEVGRPSQRSVATARRCLFGGAAGGASARGDVADDAIDLTMESQRAEPAEDEVVFVSVVEGGEPSQHTVPMYDETPRDVLVRAANDCVAAVEAEHYGKAVRLCASADSVLCKLPSAAVNAFQRLCAIVSTIKASMIAQVPSRALAVLRLVSEEVDAESVNSASERWARKVHVDHQLPLITNDDVPSVLYQPELAARASRAVREAKECLLSRSSAPSASQAARRASALVKPVAADELQRRASAAAGSASALVPVVAAPVGGAPAGGALVPAAGGAAAATVATNAAREEMESTAQLLANHFKYVKAELAAGRRVRQLVLLDVAAAGKGKTWLEKRVAELISEQPDLKPLELYQTALTGLAVETVAIQSANVRAGTFASYSARNLCVGDPALAAEKAAKSRGISGRHKATVFLMVDEVYFDTASNLDYADTILRATRGCDEFFGGIPMVFFTGDPAQLGGVVGEEFVRLYGLSASRVWRSAAWAGANLRSFVLRTSQRQESGSEFAHPVERPPRPGAEELEALLAAAVLREDYAECASLRDRLREVREADPLLSAERRLAAAIASEAWTEAAAARDEVAALTPPPPPPLRCSSTCDTEGVRVSVASDFLPSRSSPTTAQFLFRYRVRFTNTGPRAVKLVSRRWLITDANGRTETVAGPGVIGQTPTLQPGESFAYSSFCPLRSPSGSMEGGFTFEEADAPEGEQPRTFEAACARFALEAAGERA